MAHHSPKRILQEFFATLACHDTGSTLKGMPYLMDILCIKFLGFMEERLDKQRQCFRVISRDYLCYNSLGERLDTNQVNEPHVF